VWRSNQLSYRTGDSLCPSYNLLRGWARLPYFSLFLKKQPAVQEIQVSLQLTFFFSTLLSRLSRKEVFQPHLPVRLPCYDLAPITKFTLGRPLRLRTSGTFGFHGLTGGVYKARERIHRAMADARLLANPASWSRVADSSPN
jgi:hypothetical protein